MDFDIWMLLAGIGIFLFGIYLMEESLKNLSGRAFKSLIRKYTSTPLKGIASGTFSTAILQSSSAVTLMVLAFVGAGIMTMSNAIGVILGSNIGTTLTSWIVASIGFKVNIDAFALPLIGIGGLGLIFLGRSSKSSNISKLIVGFGFLFLGLDYMKVSVEELTAMFDLTQFTEYGMLFFLLIGFVITAIMQSSSAAMAIILTALYGEVIDFKTASAMAIGAGMGTTVTAILGSIGGVIAKKQVALSHVIFNIISGVIALILITPLNILVLDVFDLRSDPLIALALFQTLYKTFGVILFFPFIHQLAKSVTWLIKDKRIYLSKYIHKVTDDVPEAGVEAIDKETRHLVRLTMLHNLKIFNVDSNLVLNDTDGVNKKFSNRTPDRLYSMIKSIQSEIFVFSSKMKGSEFNEQEVERLNKVLHAIRYCVASAKTLKDVGHEFDMMENSDNPIINDRYQDFRRKLMGFYTTMEELLEKQSGAINLPRLVKLMQRLQENEKQFIKELSELIAKRKINEEEISSLLSATRSFNLAVRQLALSVKDIILNKEEADIYENMDFTEDELKKLYPDEFMV